MNNNIIIVTNEEGKPLEINVLLIFELPEFRKKYVIYTMDSENDVENTTMFISEINSTTNEIKQIDEDEIETIKKVYLELRKELLKD